MFINVTAAVGSGNETTFDLVDSDGSPVNLTALGATVVTVEVCGPLICNNPVKIDSDSPNVSFSGAVVTVKFGKLNLKPVSQLYAPKISYITASDPEPEVIAGEGYQTEIKLKVVC